MVSQAKAGCKECGSKFHTLSSCQKIPRKPIKRSPIKRKTYEQIKTAKKKRKTRTPRQKAKDAAWAAFSYYIRIRDSIATTGTITSCICVTCRERGDSTPKPFSKIQAGHAVGGRGNAVLFNEEITNGQCDYCNSQGAFGLKGDYGNYMAFLVKKYGLEHAQELQQLKGTTRVYKTHDFIEIEAYYRGETEKLLKSL